MRKLAAFIVALIALCVIVPSAAHAQTAAWLNGNWAFRNPITITNTAGTAVTNFQVNITLTSSFPFASAKSDGSDLRFTASDGVTQIPFWVQTWNATTKTASIWVQVPSLPTTGTTIYMYYGYAAATSASNGNATFLFFDDFDSDAAQATGYFTLGAAQTELVQDQAWETSAPHSFSVLNLNLGGHTYWGYYGLQGGECGGIGLAYSQDAVTWTKNATNPLFTNGRWPRVIQVGSTYYMVYEFNYCGTSEIDMSTSTDGLTWTALEQVVPPNYLTNPRNQNPDLWLNPNDGLYYLYWYSGNDENQFKIMARSATTPAGLNSPTSEVTVLSSTNVLAAPDIMYYNGTYYLSSETTDANGIWDAEVYSSKTATSGFTLMPGNPVLASGSACMFQTIFGTTLHEYYCSLTGTTWTLAHRQASLTQTLPQISVVNPAKWTSAELGAFKLLTDTQQDGSSGLVAQGNMPTGTILTSTYTGTDYILEAYGKQIQGNVWGIGFRVTDPTDYYSVNLYDNLTGSPNLYSYNWSAGAASTLGSATLGTISPNTWYKLSARVQGSTFDIYENDVLQIHTSDATHVAGPIALYGENNTVANFNNILVRQYTATDPTSTLGTQAPAPLLPILLTFSPSSVSGGTQLTGTITLNGVAPAGGAQVALSTNNAAGVIPSSVTVAGGSTTASFAMSTTPVAAATQVTITATYNGGSVTGILTVNPPSVTAVTLSPVTVVGGSAYSTGTATLNAPAPTGGSVVTLSSSNTAAATAPASVTVPAGAISADFTVTTKGVSSGTTSTITATYNGTATGTLTVSAGGSGGGGSTAFVKSAGNSGESAAYTVSIAPATGDFLAVFVWQTENANTPTSITDNKGSTYTLDCNLTYNPGFGNRRLTVYHLISAPSGVTGVTITPNTPSRAIVAEYSGMPTSGTILDVCGTVNNQTTNVTSWTSTATTTTTTDLVFGLADSPTTGNAGYAAGSGWNARQSQHDATDGDDSYLEDRVSVAAGSYTATGTSTTAARESTVVIAFKAGVPGPTLLSGVSFSPAVVNGGTSSTGTVTLNQSAPTGGAVVTLLSGSTSVVVPASVTIAAGATSATFTATTTAVGALTTASVSGTYGDTIAGVLTVVPVPTAPSFSSANSTAFVLGTAGTFIVTANGYPAPVLSETGTFPTGVSFNGVTGVLSGTATTNGNYNLTFTAHNGVGTDATQAFVLTVGQVAAFTSANNTAFVVGTAGTFTVTTTGFPTPTLSITAGTLPTGVTFNATTGVFSGTPAAGTAGSYPLTLNAHNGIGSDATQSFTLTVNQVAAITSANNTAFTINTAGTFTVTATGSPTPTLSVSGTLPTGVTFVPATGVLSGTPTVNGGFTLTFTATNGVGSPATQTFTLSVNQVPAITSANAATFVVGTAGTFTVTQTGYPVPTLSISAGTLPTGVTFNATTGVLSGTPAAGTAGSYPLTFNSHNGIGSDATQSFTLTVNQVAAITSANNTAFTQNTAGTFTVTATGTPTPTLSLASGTLPSGVTFTPATGVLAGTPNVTGPSPVTFPLTFTATNGVGSPATQAFTLTVNPPPTPPTITSANSASFKVSTAGTFTLTATGFPVPTLSVSGTLPTGVTFNTATGVLSGTPSVIGTFNLTFTAHNTSGPDATQPFTLTVVPPVITAVTLSPTSVTGGLTNSTGTVTLDVNAPTGGTVVTLGSDSAAATVLASVTVAAGAKTATFTATSHPVATVTTANISVSYNGGTLSTPLTVNPPAVSSVGLSPSSVTGGLNSTGTVTLNTAAPTGGITVTLTSGNTAVATVPASVTVAATATTATFTITTTPVVTTATSLISASFNGGTQSATLAVNPVINSAFVRVAGNSGESAAYTVTIAPTAGDFLGVFVFQTEGAAAPTVTDNAGNTYTLDCNLTYTQGFGNRRLTVYHLLNAPSGITGVRVTPNTPSRAIVAEYSGMPTTGAVLDVCGTVNSTTTNVTSWTSTAATTTSTDLVFGLEDSSTTGNAGYAAGSGWNARLAQHDATDGDDSYLEDRVAVAAGSYTATGTSTTAARESSVVVAFKTTTGPTAPTITSANSAGFAVGVAGTFTVTATGTAPITFTETGTLPAGVTLSSGGVLSGTPAAGTAGSYPITITASNGTLPNATQNFTLTVGQAPAITSANSTTFTVGTAGSFTVTATGSPAPTFTETGALPSGVTLVAATGVLSGTPAAGTGGTYAITITAANGVTPNATQSFTLTVNQAPAITSAATTAFTVGTAGTFTVTATGFPVPTFTETGTLPSGVTLSTAGVLSGTPASATQGSYPITISASNGIGTAATQSFTLTVNPVGTGGVAFVRSAGNFGESAAYTVSIAPTAGDFLSVFVYQTEGAATPTITDNRGTVYTLDCNLTFTQGFGNRRLTVYHALNVTTGITGITVTPNTPSRTIVGEYSGMASTATLDVCGTVNSTTTNVTSWTSTAATTSATDLVFGLADSATTGNAGYAAGSGWTARQIQHDATDGDDSFMEDHLNAAPGSNTATGTSTTAARESAVVVAYKNQ